MRFESWEDWDRFYEAQENKHASVFKQPIDRQDEYPEDPVQHWARELDAKIMAIHDEATLLDRQLEEIIRGKE